MDQQLREMIDACRPGGNDQHEPELAAVADLLAQDDDVRLVFERSQRLDAAFGAAFHDVPVPAGLEERLLAAVGAEQPSNASSPEVVPLPRRSRRRFLAGLIATAAAAAVALAMFWLGREPQEIARDRLVQETQAWLAGLDDKAATWKEIDEASFGFFPAQDVNASPAAWRFVATDLGKAARVYRLEGRGSAYLVVVSTNKTFRGVGAAPPRSSFPQATGGWRIGAWKKGNSLYVLAVKESEPLYRSLIRTPATA